jgi:DNA-directed RNA polymerase beta' subunit
MEFAQITYAKTVEGNFEVKLINKNTVVASITFPTETLAAEYVDLKTKMKAHAEALIAEVTANIQKAEVETKKVEAAVETKVKEVVADVAKVKADVVADVKEVEAKAETFIEGMKNKIEKQPRKLNRGRSPPRPRSARISSSTRQPRL